MPRIEIADLNRWNGSMKAISQDSYQSGRIGLVSDDRYCTNLSWQEFRNLDHSSRGQNYAAFLFCRDKTLHDAEDGAQFDHQSSGVCKARSHVSQDSEEARVNGLSMGSCLDFIGDRAGTLVLESG